jgi:SagB-type dehydrogenase family enzyme
MHRLIRPVCLTTMLSLLFLAAASAQESKVISLPKPQITGGKPLMQALNERASNRTYGPEALPLQVLSNLLWAAFGVNRPDGRRTAPSASNMQEIDIYAVMADGLYLYDAKANELKLHLAGDMRSAAGSQAGVATAPLSLLYVADYTRMGQRNLETKRGDSGTDTGYISQNVYLFCASAGLNTVARGGVDREAIKKAMQFRPDQFVVLTQTVGYPPKQ